MPRNFFCGFLSLTLAVFASARAPAAVELDSKETIDVINANNQFGIELYQRISAVDSNNIFFSPFSISLALVMVYEGARQQTQAEIGKVFHFPLDDRIRRQSYAASYQDLNRQDRPFKLHTANALWVQKDYHLRNEYLKTIHDFYAGYATDVDFIRETEPTRQRINRWVEEKTNDKIKELFPPGSLTADARLVITNAIYFKGNWVRQFDKNLTVDEDFFVSSAKRVKTPMMRRTDPEAVYNYAATEGLQLLEMPYDGDKLSMLIVLPADNDRLAALEKSLTAAQLEAWQKLLNPRRVEVFIPKFTFKTRYLLNDYLADMGMPTAFTSAADLSGIDGTRSLFIQGVIHQAFVDVYEEGTEAAAATGVVVGTSAVPQRPPVFRADHPFIFLIQDKPSRNILFLGRVVNPGKI